MTNIQKTVAIIGAFLLWTIVAVGIDRYFVRDSIPNLSQLLYFKDAEIVVKPFDRTFKWLGLSIVLILPSFLLGIAAAIFLRVRKKQSWSISIASCGILSFWFFLIPLLAWIGESIYRFAKSGLDDWGWAKGIAGFCDGFVFKGYLYSYGFHIVHIEAGLGAIVGLVLGVILYYKFGLWEIIKNKLNTS